MRTATKEFKKVLLKMGWESNWNYTEVSGFALNKRLGYCFPVNEYGLDAAGRLGKFAALDVERVIKKSGNGWKAKIYKTAELKQYIKEVLKPDDSKAT